MSAAPVVLDLKNKLSVGRDDIVRLLRIESLLTVPVP